VGCLLAIIGFFSPRLLLIILWIFTNFVDRAFDSWIVPALGLVFAPITTVVYVLVYSPVLGVSALGWVFVFFGVIADLGAYSGSYRGYRR
jgi:hypothetical protein